MKPIVVMVIVLIFYMLSLPSHAIADSFNINGLTNSTDGWVTTGKWVTSVGGLSTNSSATALHPIEIGPDGEFNLTATFAINNLTNNIKIGIVDKRGWDIAIHYQNGTLFFFGPAPRNQDFYLRQKLTLKICSEDGATINYQVPEIYGFHGMTNDNVPDKVVIEISSVAGIDPPEIYSFDFQSNSKPTPTPSPTPTPTPTQSPSPSTPGPTLLTIIIAIGIVLLFTICRIKK